MFAVALFRLGTTIDDEARALAADLGTTAYEERLRLAGGLPLVVRTLASRDDAKALLGQLRARGHGAIGCDRAAVASADALVPVRDFVLEADALVASARPDAPRLPWDDLLAIVRARHREEAQTTVQTTSRAFSPGRAVMTGGLVMRKETTRESTQREVADAQVLYLFRKSGEAPWLLRESGAHYAGLGAAMQKATLPNFLATIEALRARAAGAVYDERLLSTRRSAGQVRREGTSAQSVVSQSDAGEIDLLAHLVAQWIARGER